MKSPLITYATKLILSSQDKQRLFKTLQLQRDLVNFCSKQHFGASKNSIVDLHNKSYQPAKQLFPEAPSQLIIRAEQECLSSYRSVKSNKHKTTKPIHKIKLSYRLDKRLYSNPSRTSIKLTALGGKRITATYQMYPKLNELIDKYPVADPLIFVRKGEIWIALSFEMPVVLPGENKLAIGIDLGKRNLVATSEGKLVKGNEFNRIKRKTRYLKRCLQSRGTKSSAKHLRKIRRKETNFSRNYIHHLVNEILNTTANVFVIEDLTKIKKKKNKYQNKNNISQVPFYLLRTILEYKAFLSGKETRLVSPMFTSQKDYRGLSSGTRKGCSYLTSDNRVFHADLNAANNIALKSKHPSLLVDPVNSFRRQAVVNQPIVGSMIRLSNQLSETYKPLSS